MAFGSSKRLVGQRTWYRLDLAISSSLDAANNGLLRQYPMRGKSHSFRSGRTLLAVLIYLVGFAVLLLIVTRLYLMPTLIAEHRAGVTPEQRRILVAHSRMVMVLLLLVLLLGLLLTFRIGRFFFPRQTEPRKPTKYIDAWEEAGRRLKLDDEQADPPAP